MSKRIAIAAFKRVEQRVANRGNFYTDEGRITRMMTCAQLAAELEKGCLASFRRLWAHIQRGMYWEASEDALSEVFDELGVNTIDELYALIN